MAVLLLVLMFLPVSVYSTSCYHYEHASGIVIQEVTVINCPGMCFSGYLQIAEQDHYAGGCADEMDCEAIGEAKIGYGALGKMQGECCDRYLCNPSSNQFFIILLLLYAVFQLY